MPATRVVLAGKTLRIPLGELEFRATRSSGPGGQHVNTSSTRVELWWNPEQSAALSESQRALVRERLANRLDAEGWLRLVESGTRSQLRNRERVLERFGELLERAVTPRKVRRSTRVPADEKRRRLEAKRQRSALKRLRGPVPDAE